jgi:hypothetical protein
MTMKASSDHHISNRRLKPEITGKTNLLIIACTNFLYGCSPPTLDRQCGVIVVKSSLRYACGELLSKLGTFWIAWLFNPLESCCLSMNSSELVLMPLVIFMDGESC